MKEITEALDAWMTAQYGYTMKLWGYSELVVKSNQVMPRTITGSAAEGVQVAIDDRYQINTWMRVTALSLGNEIEGNDWGFGLKEGYVQSATLRFILAHKITIGEDFLITFIKDLPRTLDVDDYAIVSINKKGITVDPDHEAVYRTELGETAYEQHRFNWNVYAITIPIEFIPCTITSP